MVGFYDITIEFLSILLALAVVGACLLRRCFLSYFFANLYLLYAAAFTLANIYVRNAFGYTSYQYYYFYYTGDAVGNITLYVLIGWFFDRLLRKSVFHQYVRPTLIFVFLLIVGISAGFLFGSVQNFYSVFVFEFQQNIYFVGVLLTFLLWSSMSFLQAESRRFSLLVSGVGIYFAAHAVSYALLFLFPVVRPLAAKIPPLAFNLMLLLWLYTFLRVPQAEIAAVRPRQSRAHAVDNPTPA